MVIATEVLAPAVVVKAPLRHSDCPVTQIFAPLNRVKVSPPSETEETETPDAAVAVATNIKLPAVVEGIVTLVQVGVQVRFPAAATPGVKCTKLKRGVAAVKFPALLLNASAEKATGLEGVCVNVGAAREPLAIFRPMH